MRERFNLAAQATVRIIAKVANPYTPDRKRRRTFKPTGAMVDDKRIQYLTGRASWRGSSDCRRADLIYRAIAFYLHQVGQIETSNSYDPAGWLDVHLGSVTTAIPSGGDVYSGQHLEHQRPWYAERRATRPSVGTKRAKRRVKHLSCRPSRYQADTNYRISKALVETAQRTSDRRGQRSQPHTGPYNPMRTFISHKTQRAGVCVQRIAPFVVTVTSLTVLRVTTLSIHAPGWLPRQTPAQR